MLRIKLVILAVALVFRLSAQDEPHKLTEPDVTKPRIIHKVEPKYTKQALKAKIEGSIKLNFVISPQGRAIDIKVDKSLDPGLDKNAIEAVSQWRFEPSTKDGVPVAVFATATLTLHLTH